MMATMSFLPLHTFRIKTRMGKKWTRGYMIVDRGDCLEIVETDNSGHNVNGSGLRIPKDQDDIDTIARELRKYMAGPLGKLAIDAEVNDG